MKLPSTYRIFLFFTLTFLFLATLVLEGQSQSNADEKEDSAWASLFDGKTLAGWKASENKDSCRVEDGAICVNGPRSHLFYVGDVNNGKFKNFELKCKVKTMPNSNSGIYFHTDYQAEGWPAKGYEAQVNNTGGDRKKTGGLYAVQDVFEAPAKDNEWFDYHIIVNGKRIIVKINGKTTADYTEEDDLDREGRRLSSGTFALQAHDPGSKVLYKDVRVKVLP
jgi:hypothetical protein